MTDILLVVFTSILALAVLMQSVLFLLTFLSLRKLGEDLLPKIQKLTEKTEATLAVITDIAENIRPVAQKLNGSADVIYSRVVKMDGFLEEVVEKSRREIDGIEDALLDVTQRFRNSINTLSDSIILPVSRITALTKAVRAAAGSLFIRREKEKADADTSSDDFSDDKVYF